MLCRVLRHRVRLAVGRCNHDRSLLVDPMHPKKMAALMQAEAANGQSRERPILLRIEPKAGHGVGKPVTKQIEELTDVYSFLFWQLGVGDPCGALVLFYVYPRAYALG